METLRKPSSCLYVFNIWMQNDLDPRRGAMILYQPFGLFYADVINYYNRFSPSGLKFGNAF